MSRSGYCDYIDEWDLIRWRGAVKSAIRGKRGQQLLKELAEGMDAMPEKKLIAGELVNDTGDRCALGVVGVKRGLDLKGVDPEDHDQLARVFNVAAALAQEIEFINDDDFGWGVETPEARWLRVRKWVGEQLGE